MHPYDKLIMSPRFDCFEWHPEFAIVMCIITRNAEFKKDVLQISQIKCIENE